MGAAFQALKRVFRAFAPPGSRRRHALRSLRRLVGLKPADGPAAPPAPPKGADDPYNLRAINRILWLMERPPSVRPP